MSNMSIIGAGAWGTALAQMIASNRTLVTLWARKEALARDINSAHENKAYLNGIALSNDISATGDLHNALKNDILLVTTPVHALRAQLCDMKPLIRPSHVLVLCSKGIEQNTTALVTEVAADILPQTSLAVLTGPNFAIDVAAGKPAGTTLACINPEIGKTLQNAIARPHFRPYLSHDIIGAQIAGAFKNVIAIACGMAHGMNMGDSARASLITRGLFEISSLGVAMGAQHETFLGMCGVGDMTLTCSSETSRNFSLGYELGKGSTVETILNGRNSVTEGIFTAQSAHLLSAKYDVDMPISLAVHKCLNNGLSLDDAVKEMLNRPVGQEL